LALPDQQRGEHQRFREAASDHGKFANDQTKVCCASNLFLIDKTTVKVQIPNARQQTITPRMV